MNVYDFDKTIYKNDSTEDFYFFSLKRHAAVWRHVPSMIFAAIMWALGVIDKKGFKERFYRFLTVIDDIDREIEIFWDKNEYKIKRFYKNRQLSDDVVISASPEFLLMPICKRLGIKHLYASKVDKKSGKYSGENCWGVEKTKRFYEAFGKNAEIDEFYSDSLSDSPLAEIAKTAFIVKGEELTPWKEYAEEKAAKKNTAFGKAKQNFLSREFILFLAVGCINTLNGILFSWLYSLAVPNVNFAFVLGYITALTVGYILNSAIIFKEHLAFAKYIKFGVSYIPNFIIQNIVVLVFYNILCFDKLFAYALAAVIGLPITFLLVKLFAFGKK